MAIALLSTVALAGCESTQDRNARVELQTKREIGARRAVRVTAPQPGVRVTDVALVRGDARGAGAFAVAVTLRSDAPAPLTDLPILVEVVAPGGRRTALNGKAGLDWFRTHVPALAPGATTTWVLTGRRRKLPAGRLVATVGRQEPAALSHAQRLPRIDAAPIAAAAPASRAGARAVGARLTNTTDIPQAALQVYAVARAGGRVVAAGQATVARLGKQAARDTQVPLVGRAGAAAPVLSAVPTIFR